MRCNAVYSIVFKTMSKTTISFRTDKSRIDELDAIAEVQERNRSFIINEAIANYLELHEWQIDHIKKGLAAADRGEFVSSEDMSQTFKALRDQCP